MRTEKDEVCSQSWNEKIQAREKENSDRKLKGASKGMMSVFIVNGVVVVG
jgi:hypothetical protein